MYRLPIELLSHSNYLPDIIGLAYLQQETLSPFKRLAPAAGALAVQPEVVIKTCREMDQESFIIWVDQGLAYE